MLCSPGALPVRAGTNVILGAAALTASIHLLTSHREVQAPSSMPTCGTVGSPWIHPTDCSKSAVNHLLTTIRYLDCMVVLCFFVFCFFFVGGVRLDLVSLWWVCGIRRSKPRPGLRDPVSAVQLHILRGRCLHCRA